MRVHQLIVGSMAVCCYIVSCEKSGEAAVIDPGGDEEQILALLREERLNARYIINTHGHPDHVCGNGPVQAATGAKIVMHEADAAFFADPKISHYFAMLGMPESPPPDLTVKEGDAIAVGEERLQVLHTPGHTPGGMCLYAAPHCFTGDTLFVGGVGRTDLPGGAERDLFSAIRAKLLVLPPETIVWPGHGYGGYRSTIGEEARTNPCL